MSRARGGRRRRDGGRRGRQWGPTARKSDKDIAPIAVVVLAVVVVVIIFVLGATQFLTQRQASKCILNVVI